MTKEVWAQVDAMISELVVPSDPILDAALAASRVGDLPSIQVTSAQGKFLHLLARAVGAKRVLEVGTLGGYSSIWLGRAVAPDGRVTTLELNPHHAEVARANLARAELSSVVEVVLGPALESLRRFIQERRPPFDLVFIDADKPLITEYLEASERLSHPGTVIVVDNVVREGEVLDATSPDPRVQGVRRFLEHLSGDRHVSGTVIQTVSEKKYDGFALLVVDRPRDR